jgi:hypothetical protein
MASIKAYVYNTQEQANTALNSINLSLGIPKNIDSVTQSYTYVMFNNSKYIIKHDEVIESILGLPTDFDYLVENPIV